MSDTTITTTTAATTTTEGEAISSPTQNKTSASVAKQQYQQQQLSSALLSPTLMTNGVPNIDLVKTTLVKNRVEIDFSAKAIKEGLFSMWTSCADKKISYSSRDLNIKIEPPQLVFGDSTSTVITPSTVVNGGVLNSLNGGTGGGLTVLMKNSASVNQTTTGTSIKEEDAVAAFEYIHHCIFFSLSPMKKDVIQPMNNYFIQLIKENPSNVKSILTCLFDVFTYYRTIAKTEEVNDAKRFGALSLALDRFIEETLSNGLRDASEFSLSHLQKQFTTHLTEQFKKMANQDSSLFNDATQKFNYILSQAVEVVESIEKSKVISKAMKLDTYHEKIARQKSKALSSKEFFLFHLKFRKMNIDSRPFYGRANFPSEKSFLQWKKVEENNLQKLSQQLQPKEDYLKSVWGLKYKEKDTIGVISIKVVQARDLIEKEGSIVKPEPHVEIEFENEKKRTRKVSGLNPVWKEHFNFQITKNNQNAEIEFNVWDSQGTDKESKVFLGRCKFNVPDVMNYLKREVNWFPLQKRSSRSKVSGDIRLQFHYLEYPNPSSPYPNHFHYYRILLEKLLSVDIYQQTPNSESPITSSNNNINNSPSGANRASTLRRLKTIDITKPVSLLSNQSTLILKDYAERYGLLEHTTKLILVEYLIKLIIDDMALEYIPEVRGILKYILEIKFSESCALTIIEEKILKELVEKLSVACNTWISHFHSVFPLNTPGGSLRMLIDIYYLIRSSELCQLSPLPEIIKEMYEKRFHQATIMAQDMIKGSEIGKAGLVIRVCDILLSNLEIDQRYFARDFPTDVNILTISIQVYNQLLEKEIDELTEQGAHNPQELTEFLELYFKLKETTNKFKDIDQKLPLLPIPILFKQCVLQWILHSADQLQQLIDKLCQNEEWTPVSDDTLHSKSVGEVFLGCYHALDVIKSLRWEDLQKYHKDGEHSLFEIFTNFTIVISESIIYYTTVIRDLSLKALDEAADDIFLLSDSYNQGLAQTIQTVSLRFNNIQACLGHTEDLITVLLRIMESYRLSPSIVNEMSKHTYKAINDNVRTLVDRIYNRLSPVIIGEIYNIVGIDLDKSKNFVVGFFKQIEKNIDQLSNTNNQLPVSVQLTPLLEYISSKLQLFSQYLYYPLTKQLLKRLWAGIINILDDMIFPSNKRNLQLSSHQLDMIDGMVKCFGEFFYIDGEGLTRKAIDKQSERFIIIIMAYRDALNRGVRDFDPLGLKNALKNINLSNLRPDLGALRKLNINLKGIPKQLDVISLIKQFVKERKERDERSQENRKTFNLPKIKLPFKIVLVKNQQQQQQQPE